MLYSQSQSWLGPDLEPYKTFRNERGYPALPVHAEQHEMLNALTQAWGSIQAKTGLTEISASSTTPPSNSQPAAVPPKSVAWKRKSPSMITCTQRSSTTTATRRGRNGSSGRHRPHYRKRGGAEAREQGVAHQLVGCPTGVPPPADIEPADEKLPSRRWGRRDVPRRATPASKQAAASIFSTNHATATKTSSC